MKGNTQKESEERPVLVTTAHKGVFMGWATETSGTTIKLRSARLCVYWSTDLQGFMGLAAKGPNGNCKIGPPADIEVRDITAVVEVTPEAVIKWKDAKWSA